MPYSNTFPGLFLTFLSKKQIKILFERHNINRQPSKLCPQEKASNYDFEESLEFMSNSCLNFTKVNSLKKFEGPKTGMEDH